MTQRYGWFASVLFSCAVAVAACGDDEDAATGATTPAATSTATSGPGGSGGSGAGGAASGGGGAAASDVYEFESKFTPGVDAVVYHGQSLRQVLIQSLSNYVGGLTAGIDTDAINPTDIAYVVAALDFYYQFDEATSGTEAHGVSTTPDPLQATFGEIGSADLQSKMAGNDTVTDHKDWSTEFVGWSDVTIAQNGGGITSPEALFYAFAHTLGKLAVDRDNGIVPFEPGTTVPIAEVYVTAQGRDLKQLLQKFLLMGVTYSQGTDDYLHDDVADKGILVANTQDGDAPYTTLGHHWDEAFGYFGAARDYLHYTDEEIAGSGGRPDWQIYHDTNGDGAIDLEREHNWAASTNAAKRDVGASEATDFTLDGFDAFLQGRALIHGAGDMLTSDELDTLTGHAEAATLAWERAIAATVVHYINDTIADTEAVGTSGYSFLDHAKHWSEMKGFALGLQFNPKKQISDTDFVLLHTYLRDAPVLSTATQTERDLYVTELLAARDILQLAYGFSQANVEGW